MLETFSAYIRVGVQEVIKVGIQRKKRTATAFKTETEMQQGVKK